jgi:5'-nucleotidase
MGRKHFWFSVVPIEGTEKGTDRWAVEQGYVSMTPLSIDLTNEKDLTAAIAQQPVG